MEQDRQSFSYSEAVFTFTGLGGKRLGVKPKSPHWLSDLESALITILILLFLKGPDPLHLLFIVVIGYRGADVSCY